MKSLSVFLVSLGEYLKTAPSSSPPLGILSLAAWARSKLNGVHFTLLDQRLERIDYAEVSRRTIAARPDVVGLSFLTSAAAYVPGATRAIREALPDCTILLGGPHPSAAGMAALEDTKADVAVAGEGEIAFELILRALQEGGGLESIPGIFRRLPDGSMVQNPGTLATIANLDDLPFLAYDLVDVPRYWTAYSQLPLPPPRKYLVLSTSRGCPYHCIYCHDIFGKTFRAQSPERIVTEMEFLQKRYGALDFDFSDDVFNLDKRRVCGLSEEMGRHGLRCRLHMVNGLRTDILTQEVVDALLAAGLRTCATALESGSDRIQTLMGKNLNIDRFLRGVEMLARRRVFTYTFTMFGFPTETAHEMQMTIDTLKRSRLHMAFFFKVTPYPKTRLHDLAVEMFPERMRNLDFANHDIYYNPVVNLSAVSDDELLSYLREATRTFYGDPARLFRFVRDCPHPLRLLQFIPGAIRQSFSRTRGRYRSKE